MTDEEKQELEIARVVDQARACRASQLVVEARDGREIRVSLAPRGRRQLAARRVLVSYDWTRCTMVDAAGSVLDTAIREADLEAAAEAADAPAPAGPLPQSREAELMIVMTAAQAQVLDRFAAMVKPMVDGYQALASVVSARLEHAEAMNAAQLEAQQAWQAEQVAKQDAEETSNVERMVTDIVGRYLAPRPAPQLPDATKQGNGG